MLESVGVKEFFVVDFFPIVVRTKSYITVSQIGYTLIMLQSYES